MAYPSVVPHYGGSSNVARAHAPLGPFIDPATGNYYAFLFSDSVYGGVGQNDQHFFFYKSTDRGLTWTELVDVGVFGANNPGDAYGVVQIGSLVYIGTWVDVNNPANKQIRFDIWDLTAEAFVSASAAGPSQVAVGGSVPVAVAELSSTKIVYAGTVSQAVLNAYRSGFIIYDTDTDTWENGGAWTDLYGSADAAVNKAYLCMAVTVDTAGRTYFFIAEEEFGFGASDTSNLWCQVRLADGTLQAPVLVTADLQNGFGASYSYASNALVYNDGSEKIAIAWIPFESPLTHIKAATSAVGDVPSFTTAQVTDSMELQNVAYSVPSVAYLSLGYSGGTSKVGVAACAAMNASLLNDMVPTTCIGVAGQTKEQVFSYSEFDGIPMGLYCMWGQTPLAPAPPCASSGANIYSETTVVYSIFGGGSWGAIVSTGSTLLPTYYVGFGFWVSTLESVVPPAPSSSVPTRGGTFKAAWTHPNPYDCCLVEQRERHAHLRSRGRPCVPECYKDREPWILTPREGREFHKQFVTSIPAVEQVDTLMGSFTVPTGYDGVAWGILTRFYGGGFEQGSGDVYFRVRINLRWAKDLGNISVELGTLGGGYFPLPEHMRLESDQLVGLYAYLGAGALGRLSPGSTIIMGLDGWYYPRGYWKEETYAV